MEKIFVKRRRRIGVLVILVLGAAVLAALQWKDKITEITPRPLLHLIADLQREAESVPLALTRVSDEEENEIGRQLGLRYGADYRRNESPDTKRLAELISSVGARLAAGVKRKGIHYRFYFLDDPGFVNAFAMPGGQIVFGRGLLQLLESEDELASILGHEISHVDERHCIERLQYELQSRKLGLGGLYRLGRPAVVLFQAGYTKEKEAEADRAGLALSVAAGYSPAGAIAVMKRFDELYGRAQRPAASPLDEILRIPLQSLQEYFRSHPPPRERIALFEQEIAAHGWDKTQPVRPLPLREVFLTASASDLAARGELAEAVKRFEEALRLNPNYVPAWEGLANARWSLGQADAAVKAATEGLKREPGRQQLWSLLGKFLMATDAARAPARLAKLAGELDPPENAVFPAWNELMLAAWRAGDAASAAESAEQALRLIPDRADTWILLARALAASRGASAPATFNQLRKSLLESRDKTAEIVLVAEATAAGLEAWAGRAAALDAFWQKTTGLGAVTEARLRRELAWWLHRAGKLNEAYAQLDAARQRYPGIPETQNALAWVLSDMGRQSDAERELMPTNSGEGFALQALLAWRKDEFQAAQDIFRRAAGADGEWLEPRWVANNCNAAAVKVFTVLQAAELDRLGKFERSVELYRGALPQWSGSLPVWEGYARAAWHFGDAGETARAATEALKRNPGSAELWDLVARALAAADRRSAASRFERGLADLKPPNAETLHLWVELAGLRYFAGDARGLEAYRQRFRAGMEASVEGIIRRRMAWWMYRAGQARPARNELEAGRLRNLLDARAFILFAWVESDVGDQASAENLRRAWGEGTAGYAALESLILWRRNEKQAATAAFERAAQQDAVWTVPRWVQNNYSAAAAKVFLDLQAALKVRKRQEAGGPIRVPPATRR